MVATWTPAASAGYYSKQTAYYAGSKGVGPQGTWFAPGGDHGVLDGAIVDPDSFERLFAGRNAAGYSLVTNGGNRLDRVPAFDVTLSAPRSVSLLWALGEERVRDAIEQAHAQAVRATLELLEREATFARRGRGGGRIEKVRLTAATFCHGESRPAEHADGETFADPNLHTHCVVLNLATRSDGSVGALHSTILRDWKMAAGAAYHAALAAGVMEAGLAIDRIGKNGVFEILGIDDEVIGYFSARRQEIVTELAEAGLESKNAVAAAALVAKTTRSAKVEEELSREEAWASAAGRIGFDAGSSVSLLAEMVDDPASRETLLEDRLAELPVILTQTKSVLDRRELFRAVGEALVGTGLSADRIGDEVERLLESGVFVELGRDRLGFPRYSTPEMIRIEREIVDIASKLCGTNGFAIARERLEADYRRKGLSEEQIAAVREAARPSRIAVVEGAPGTGKTTLLSPLVEAWRGEGYRVVGAATAWRVANALSFDLGIEARATASWLARCEHGKPFLDDRTVLIVDEAGLLSSREMHGLLTAADNAGAKVMFTGDRDQLQAIGAGSGLRLVTHAVEAAKVLTIVRQHDPWAREAVTAFGQGDAKAGLDAFADRGLLKEADGQAAAIRAVVDHLQNTLTGNRPEEALVLARTNAEIAAIGREVRARLQESGCLKGPDIEIDAVTPSGHTNRLALAAGDRLRFQVRNDGLGVVNGTTATVTNIFITEHNTEGRQSSGIEIEARVGDRIIRFDTSELADDKGRARLGWAYASTIYGAQGGTVERAVVLLTPSFDRHDIYVAASRARKETLLVVDRRQVDREMHSSLTVSADPDPESRRQWLANRLSQQHVKETTLDVGRRVTNSIQSEQTADTTRITPDYEHPSTLKHTQQRAWENDHAF